MDGVESERAESRIERDHTMEFMTDSQDWLRVTLSSIGDGVITTDRHGNVTFLNPIAESLTGWMQDQGVGQALEHVFHIVNEDTRQKVENPAMRALRDGVVVGLANHTLLISRDQTERPIDDSAAPIRNAAGEVAGTVLVFRDITERRDAEHALRDSELRYRRLFQTAKVGILILDVESGRIIDANAFMGALVGLDPDELFGKQLHEIGMFCDTEENKAAFRDLKQNRYLRYEHLPVQNRRGERVEVEFIANVYTEGEALVAQCNVRDISERVQMERKIAEQAAAIASESRRKDEFLAMLSHELRNPLAPIRSAVHLLRIHERGSENPIQQQAREVIERQVASLTKLVSDLLEVSRVVSGRIRLDRQVLDLNQVVKHAIQTVAPLVEQRRHEVVFDSAVDSIWVNADSTRLEEILINLLSNSAKYTPDGGVIEVHCEQPLGANYAEVRVRDNGVGIDAKVLPRIFDLFTQADRSLDRAAGGLGIGLSLAHRLVGLHGGTIEAKSPPDGRTEGSEFIVQLAIAPTPLALATPEPVIEPSRCVDEHRVLVVDDNIDQAMMLSSLLRHSGYNVQSAYTGPEGLNIALQWLPDTLLLDIGLPGLDGYEVARRIRSERTPGCQEMRLIALTGYGRESDVTLAREAGFDAHLVKPCDLAVLESLIATPLDRASRGA